MVSALISRVVILVFGTLYPAYSSYKAVKTKNVKEYVKWMMYWIVFALFTSVETFADVLVSWFPFYYELKIAFVVWLLSPATKGSSVLYRKFVHPELMKREGEIDQTLERVKTQGYSALVNVGQQGINYAMEKALTGQHKMMDQLMKKSFSMGDLSQQQSGAKVTYTPDSESTIPEAADEPDHTNIPVASAPPVERDILQGGDHAAVTVPVPDPLSAVLPPAQDLTSSSSGYNLRSHEIHEEPQPAHYKHSEDLPEPDLVITSLPAQGKTVSNIVASKAPTNLKKIAQRPIAKRRSRSRSLGRKRKLKTKASAK